MQYYQATATGQYFTAGKLYPVLDVIEDGILTADDENKEHYLSGSYLIDHFRAASSELVRLLSKLGRI